MKNLTLLTLSLLIASAAAQASPTAVTNSVARVMARSYFPKPTVKQWPMPVPEPGCREIPPCHKK